MLPHHFVPGRNMFPYVGDDPHRFNTSVINRSIFNAMRAFRYWRNYLFIWGMICIVLAHLSHIYIYTFFHVYGPIYISNVMQSFCYWQNYLFFLIWETIKYFSPTAPYIWDIYIIYYNIIYNNKII